MSPGCHFLWDSSSALPLFLPGKCKNIFNSSGGCFPDSALPSSLSGHCLAQVLPHDRAHMSWLSGSGPHVTTR